MAAEGTVTWRSWFDAGQDGPIHAAWNVRKWPTLYVLDAKGVIRFRDVAGDKLERAVEQLLAETETAAPAPSK